MDGERGAYLDLKSSGLGLAGFCGDDLDASRCFALAEFERGLSAVTCRMAIGRSPLLAVVFARTRSCCSRLRRSWTLWKL